LGDYYEASVIATLEATDMRQPVKHVLYAACVVGVAGTVSLVRSQTPDARSSNRIDQLALQDSAPPAPGQPPQPDASIPAPAGAASDKIIEQTRGPLNQGFAEMTNMTPQPAPPVAKQPPAPIDEAPPDVKPDNPDATWVPGYWSWDAESNNYIWVSGSWRVPPPGHRWIPGYWSEGDGNYQWVSGFWTPEEVEDVTYLPAPPPYRDESVDVSTPPDSDHFWVPGYWAYQTQAYQWQPGYWSRVVTGWMWIPAHYEWSPYGYVFIAGHWDYPLDQRGMLFAPVAFSAPIYLNRAFVYTPQNLVALDALVDNLFVAPGYQSYFFGDYYGPQYARFGIYPWFNVGVGPYLYDPIFAYRTTMLWRTNPRWRDDFRRRYDRLVRDPALRPPRTWRDYQRLVRDGRLPRDRMVALPLRDALRDDRFKRNIVRVTDADRRTLRTQSEFRRNLVTERTRLERPDRVPDRRPGDRTPERPGLRPGERPDRPGERPDRPVVRPGDRPMERPERPDRPGDRPERPIVRPGERPGDRPERPDRPANRPERPVVRPGERPGDRPERPVERPGERPGVKPDVRRDRPATAEAPRAPRTLHLPNGRTPEAGRGAAQPEQRREAPRTPAARPAPPRAPQPDRAVRTPAPRAAPEREKK
jgi:hypothetical protein